MSTSRYAALPNPRFAPDAEREMEDAFDLNDEHHNADMETTPLTHNVVVNETPQAEFSSFNEQSTTNQIQSYDFEREYDFPPPGSPPPPSAESMPNDYGNSNGLLPSSPIDRPQHKQPLFRRIMSAILPSQYQPVATESPHLRRAGGGTDGVFANVVAKPQPARSVRTDNGEVIVMSEESQKDTPPVRFYLLFSTLGTQISTPFPVLPGSASRCSSSLLGNNNTCPWSCIRGRPLR